METKALSEWGEVAIAAYGFGKDVPSRLAVAVDRGGNADASRCDTYFSSPVATHGYSASINRTKVLLNQTRQPIRALSYDGIRFSLTNT
jgi:hypothetical protein